MRRSAGFTLVEILVAMSLIGVVAGLLFINLLRPQNSASQTGALETLVADVKSQQIKAMSGDSGSASSAQAHGIYVQSGSYTLYKGASYSAGDSDNFVVQAPTGVTFSTTFASTQLNFTKGSGDVTSFVNGQNTITVNSSSIGTAKVITVNRYGAVTVN